MANEKQVDQVFEAARGNTRLRLEQWAHNPTCEANTISAVKNVRMADVAVRAGIRTTFGQSPFAIARGDQFEKSLFSQDGKRLKEELIKKGVLPADADGFADLRIRKNGGAQLNSLDEAIAQTIQLIKQVANSPKARRSSVPCLVAGATVRVPKGILLPEAILIVDALVIRYVGDQPQLIVGEIKTYPDRGGHTNPGELALARAQAGIYVHGLDLVVAELGVGDRVEISRQGFLVLSRPGSNQPSVRPNEDLRYQADRAVRGFELLERAAAALGPGLWATSPGDPPDALLKLVLEATTNYSESCLSFCDLASRCYEVARSAGDPIILGEDMVRFLGTVKLDRAIELLTGGKPRGEAERDLCRSIKTTSEVIANDVS